MNKSIEGLKLIKTFQNTDDLAKYFFDLQEEYNIELCLNRIDSNNLKISCSSYGYDNDNNDIPYYIIRYNNVEGFQLFEKNEGNWENVKVFTKLFELYSNQTIKPRINWEKYLLTHENFINSPIREPLRRSLNKLNIPWNQIDLNLFWEQFHLILLDLQGKRNFEDINILKNLISLTILRCNVIKNEINVTNRIIIQTNNLKINFENLLQSSSSSSSSSDINGNSELDMSQRESSHDSIPSLTSTNSPLSPVTSDNGIYTYHKNILNPMEPASATNQIVNNFNSHFKLMAEDYELFELKTKFHRRKSTGTTSTTTVRRRRNKDQNTNNKLRVSKVKSRN
ncbi:similar to Saccharomyces cerevisiae YKR011C Putative protein of unknown function [Maudiozyma saulgeensis]|uniref:Uncharacterized protein n=1 Tax=Maudiozyma saulgeensis TaxID=1789683 RepID=A0A1X7R0Q3_9SACH|nr:similar to Saccharomyces cerevisiae YKR011C Putative protein of unknown function [Kazachstania saulgeensis]